MNTLNKPILVQFEEGLHAELVAIARETSKKVFEDLFNKTKNCNHTVGYCPKCGSELNE